MNTSELDKIFHRNKKNALKFVMLPTSHLIFH